MNRVDEILIEDKVEKALADADLSIDYVECCDGIIHVHITWGDWKHDHWRCDYIMSGLGYRLLNEVVTEEDGSDCYSALHTYVKGHVADKDAEKIFQNRY